MKKLAFLLLLSGFLASTVGCDRGTTGGPKAPPAPDNKAPVLASPSEDTFSLGVSNVKLSQGESKNVTISIHRGKNFDQDVKLSFLHVPKDITFDPANPLLKRSEKEV